MGIITKKLGLFVFLLLQVAAVGTVSLESALAHSSDDVLCDYFPANNMHFPVRNDGKQMTYSQFKKILNATEMIYKPQFAALGLGNFNVVDSWTNDDVNACASVSAPCSVLRAHPEMRTQRPKERFVEIFGGLARHPYISPEGLMLVVCHEIGHHLGGYPRYNENMSGMSTEGQADYFATAKCARAIYSAMNPKTNQNWAWANKTRLPVEVTGPCMKNFPGQPEAAIYCARSSMAALALAQVLGTTQNGARPNMSFDHKDPSVVTATFESHSKAQCRLDTYVAGALCGADPQVPFSPANPTQGACVDHQKDGTRPACWYKDPLEGPSAVIAHAGI